MSKQRGQSRNRKLKRNVISPNGQSLRRPFNNKKRTIGRKDQLFAEKFYRYMKERLEEYKKEQLEKEFNDSEGDN